MAGDLRGVLREVREPHGRAALHLAGVGSQLAGEQSHQRRLARAVDADERDPVARAEPPRDVPQQRPRRRTRRDTSSASSTLSPRRAVAKRSSSARVARLGLVGDQRVGGLDAELRLRRPRRRPAAQPGELLAQQLLAALVARGRMPVALGAGEDVGRVAALVLVHAAVGDLPGRGADRVEEPAVVRHDQQRAAARREMAREPVDALDVEVVGRLVEQQQLGAVEQQRASAIRRRSPPESGADRACRGRPGSASSRRRRAGRRAPSRNARVARPLVVGAAADELVADRAARRRARRPARAARAAGRRARVTAPASGVLDAGDERAAASTCRRRCGRRRRSGRPPRRRA